MKLNCNHHWWESSKMESGKKGKKAIIVRLFAIIEQNPHCFLTWHNKFTLSHLIILLPEPVKKPQPLPVPREPQPGPSTAPDTPIETAPDIPIGTAPDTSIGIKTVSCPSLSSKSFWFVI